MTSPSGPRSLSILITIYALQGLGLLAYGLYLISLEGWFYIDPGLPLGRLLPFAIIEEFSFGLTMVLIALLILLLAIALGRIKRWAWTFGIGLQGLSLLAALLEYLHHRPAYVAMVFGIVIVFYLNQAEVQDAFRGAISERNG